MQVVELLFMTNFSLFNDDDIIFKITTPINLTHTIATLISA